MLRQRVGGVAPVHVYILFDPISEGQLSFAGLI